MAKSLLIKDISTEERIEIVKNELNFGSADCEGIDLADINREFSEKHAGCIRAEHDADQRYPGCALG